MSNSLVTVDGPTLVKYNMAVDLLEVRRHPETYPRIGTTQFPDAVSKMREIVYASFLYRNQDTTPETINFMASALVKEILADTELGLKYLSWVEIGRAIRKAVLGAGSEFYGVSVSTLYKALVDYAKNEGHEISRQL